MRYCTHAPCMYISWKDGEKHGVAGWYCFATKVFSWVVQGKRNFYTTPGVYGKNVQAIKIAKGYGCQTIQVDDMDIGARLTFPIAAFLTKVPLSRGAEKQYFVHRREASSRVSLPVDK